MKRIILIVTAIALPLFVVASQQVKTEVLERLEQGSQTQQLKGVTKGGLRLFGEKDDLTTVIVIVPAGTEVDILSQDGDYLLVRYGDYTGYLIAGKVEVKGPVQTVQQQTVQQQQVAQQQGVQQQKVQQQQGVQQKKPISAENRMSYLVNKYDRSIASRIYAGKIWKGMSSDMVRDAWGEPDRTNTVTVEGVIKEEWIYRSTWLLIEQGKLKEWGPVGR
jgi:type II secretory pathway pseudopilin PulG